MLISHKNNLVQADVIKQRIKQLANPLLPVDEELKLLDELSQFPLGQFLLANKGLNGYWTAYAILTAPKKDDLHPLEDWLVNRSPGFIATQQRFAIFQDILKRLIKNNMNLASIPCGLMDDLLTLDYSAYDGCHLTGIDLDSESLDLACNNAKTHCIKNISVHKRDAWDLNINKEFDVITSNGLNIYEQNDERVVNLYKQFHQSLKKTGYLLTSFITPPPSKSIESPWKISNSEDLLKQVAIFSDILQVGWNCFRTEQETCLQLEAAGFKVEKIIYDEQCIFPTVLAKKI